MEKLQVGLDSLKSALLEEQTLAMVAEAIQKSITNSTYTFSPSSRSIFNAENLDPVVKLIVPTATPIRNLIPRKSGAGQAAAWKKLTSRLDPQAGGTGTSGFFADAGAPNETTQSYSVATAAYKLLGRKLSIGLMAIAASQNHVPIEEAQTRIKTREVMLAEEDAIINADSSVDTNAFDGLLKQITTNSGTASLLTASGVGIYDNTVFNAGGMASHLFLGARQSRALSDELQGSGSIQRIVVSDQGAAVANLRVSKIISPNSGSPIELVVSRYMGAWAILGSMQSEAGENYIEMEDLIPMIKLDVPVTTFAKDSFVVEATVLKLIAEPFWYKIGGLATGN